MPISQAIAMAPTGTRCARLSRRRPKTAVNRKPNSGRAMISGTSESNIRRPRGGVGAQGPRGQRSLAHRVVLVDERGLPVPVDRDGDRQADRRLGRGDGHYEEGEHRTPDAEL